MSEPIKNRYDFVVYFDVTRATCRASTRRQGTVSSPMFA